MVLSVAMAGRTKRTSLYADLDLLRTSFEAQDSEKSGYIGYSELTKLACEMQGFEESMVPELMERLDRDKDGKVRLWGCGSLIGANWA